MTNAWRAFADVHAGRVVTFGFSERADVRGRRDGAYGRGHAVPASPAPAGSRRASRGATAILNILAALAVARVFEIAPGALREAVRELAPAPMRGRRFRHGGVTIIDDCYNANPDAVRAMLETLRDTPARRRIAVLGEMLELGRLAGTLHQKIGRDVAACGVDVLVGIRGAARQMADAAVAAGLPDSAAYFFSEPEQAGDYVAALAREGDAILFKGSRGTHVERALERLLSRGEPRETAPVSNHLPGAPGDPRRQSGDGTE